MEKILITGAGGFIGRAIAKLAAGEKDWEVYILSSGRRKNATIQAYENVHVETADLRDPSQCETLIKTVRPNILLHLAWNLEGRDYRHSSANVQWLEISLRLLRFFEEAGGRYFVFAGSSSEYGESPTPCSENGLAHPCDLYGNSKLAFTNFAKAFCASKGIRFASIRYFCIYGPEESRALYAAVPASINSMLQGEKFICKAPNNVWEYVYIDDAAEATIRVIQKNFCGIVNVGGDAISMRELFTIMAEQIGNPAVLIFENEDMPGKYLTADTKVLREEIGYTRQTDIRLGLAKTIAWWKLQNMKNQEEET